MAEVFSKSSDKNLEIQEGTRFEKQVNPDVITVTNELI